jgi:elongation factor P
MYQTSDIRKNLKIKMDGAPWTVVDFLFVKPGKGTAFTRTKLKNLITGQVVEKNIRTGENLESVDLLNSTATMMYLEGDVFNFMDTSSYEQFAIHKDIIGSSGGWLLENMEVELLFYEGRVVSINLPNFVEMEIVYCEPAVKGDTATNTTKEAELSTGVKIGVPLFITQGETIRIDTRTGEYGGRVSK